VKWVHRWKVEEHTHEDIEREEHPAQAQRAGSMDRRHIHYSVHVPVPVHMIVAADCIRNYSAGSASHHAHAGGNVSVMPVRGG